MAATPFPQPNKLDWGLLSRIIDDLAERIKEKLEPFDAESFLRSKKGRLRKRYSDAYQRICKQGFDLNKDSDIAAFVKLERYYEEGKAPRMIMGRNPKFNIVYAQLIEPVEKAFFKLEQVANACDYKSCGEKFEKLIGDWFVENDMSKFEGSQRFLTLRMEHAVYAKVLGSEWRELLDAMFAYKIRKQGSTKSGCKFTFWECRGSGDMDTGLGNGILNFIATQYFLAVNYCGTDCGLSRCTKTTCKSLSFVLKGDDSYSSIPRNSTYINTYEYFGFAAKIIIRTSPEDVEFCSGHFVEHAPGKYIYVQKLQKLIESLTTVVNQDILRNGWVSHYYKTLGMMYKQLYKGLPIYDDIANFLLKTSKLGINVNLIDSYNLINSFQNSSLDSLEIDEATSITSVALVNKMSIAELQYIRDFCRTSELKFPTELSKRCNLKTVKILEDDLSINFSQINAQVIVVNMPKKIKAYHNRLRSNDLARCKG